MSPETLDRHDVDHEDGDHRDGARSSECAIFTATTHRRVHAQEHEGDDRREPVVRGELLGGRRD